MGERLRYRFVGRGHLGNGRPFYIWHAKVPGDSRDHEVRCLVDWFWNPGLSDYDKRQEIIRQGIADGTIRRGQSLTVVLE